MKKYFFDLDGTITENHGYGISEFNIPWIILWIFLLLYKPKINKKVLQIIHNIKEENQEIIIVTARPEKTRKITEKYLLKNNVYFDKIFFVGPGKDSFLKKIEIVSKDTHSLFFENSRKVVMEAEEKGIKCVLIKKQDK